jgi:RNA recognition motif-containing protein
MPKKLYVGNLANDMTDSHLHTVFALYGKVHSAQVAVERETGQSRGYGVVLIDSDDQALTAIRALNRSRGQGCPKVLASLVWPVSAMNE